MGSSQVHFKGFSGKPAIEKERDRLLDLIDNQHQDRLAEVQAAITEIKQVLQNAGLGQKEEATILGSTWEANFENSFRYKSSSDIQAEKAKITTKINDYLNQESSNSKTIIAEIENMLRTSGVNENILGADWRKKLQAKSKNEREAEKNRLIKLIEDEIKRKKDAGELSETEAAEKKKELVKKSAVSAKKQIESKLTEGHQKLAVDEAELAAQLAPYNTIEEKLNSLAEAEEVATFENDLLVVIDQKKKDKLDNIANEAIAEIKKEIDGDQNVELGVNEDFENVIKGLVDPDEIESLKSKIVKLVREQKLSQSLEGTNTSSDGKNPNSPSLLKVLGITALIFLPLAAAAFIILRARRRRLREQR